MRREQLRKLVYKMFSKGSEQESSAMKFFKRLGLNSLAWSLRRLYCPVSKEALVLEVGSGGNPYCRANVLCDAHLDTVERFSEKLITDRPIVLAEAEKLPFSDDSFDFVIASHVLEHSKSPDRFISEIQRVGRAGYIEVPDAFMERLTNYPFHMLEITDTNGILLIRKKMAPTQDKELFELFKNKARKIAQPWFSGNPFDFHVRYYWSRSSGGIKYKILNPEYAFDWEPATLEGWIPGRGDFKTKLKKIVLFLARKVFSQNIRNRKIKLADILVCPDCRAQLILTDNAYKCSRCGRIYGITKRIPNFV